MQYFKRFYEAKENFMKPFDVLHRIQVSEKSVENIFRKLLLGLNFSLYTA